MYMVASLINNNDQNILSDCYKTVSLSVSANYHMAPSIL